MTDRKQWNELKRTDPEADNRRRRFRGRPEAGGADRHRPPAGERDPGLEEEMGCRRPARQLGGGGPPLLLRLRRKHN